MSKGQNDCSTTDHGKRDVSVYTGPPAKLPVHVSATTHPSIHSRKWYKSSSVENKRLQPSLPNHITHAPSKARDRPKAIGHPLGSKAAA